MAQVVLIARPPLTDTESLHSSDGGRLSVAVIRLENTPGDRLITWL
jgi:hypothetical protein